RSKEELLQMIIDQNLPPKPRENTLQYAGFCRAGGRRYRFSKEVNYATLTFKDKLPRARPEVEEVLQRHWKMRAGKRVPEPLRLLWERWNFHRLKKRFGWNFGFNYRKKKPGQKARKPAPTA
ncbi:MAG TPA: hypothetical protein VNB29_07485, partial [Chthoniobacterales bacterium]|nr:hypothetical protein [Chthoniobacterales bacterium]